MKRWCSAALVLALLFAPSFLSAEPVENTVVISPSGCCCCPSENTHTGTAACGCDGCARKNAQDCGCVLTVPALAALPVGTVWNMPLPLSGQVAVYDFLYAGRTDPPLLRPPIVS